MRHSDFEDLEERALNALKKRNSMSFLELSSVADVDEVDLADVIDHLKAEGVVKVIDSEDEFGRIVMMRQQALAMGW